MTTINKEEIQKFSRLADEWWDVEGKFKPLHMFNPTRIEYILSMSSSQFKINKDHTKPKFRITKKLVLSTKDNEDQITIHKVNNRRATAVMITGFDGGFE